MSRKPFKLIKVDSPEADMCVLYRHYPTEFDVQMDLYLDIGALCADLDNGSEVKSEVSAFYDKIKCRFDLVVFKGQKPVCAIEVKRWKQYDTDPQSPAFKQKMKYKLFSEGSGIPVLYCKGVEEIEKVHAAVLDIIA